MFRSTDWHIPSPSSTPKSLTFPDASLKTPKTETFAHSHFLDAWATPLPNEQHTPVQTPSFTLSTSIHRSLSAYSQPVRTPEDPDFHVNHFAPQNLPLPPVDASRRLSSSPDPNKLTRLGRNPPLSSSQTSRPVAMDFSHMQTPPPTRDTSSRRGPPQAAANGVGTPATVIHRTPVQAPSSEAFFDQTPFGFGNLQYTSDMMQFPGLDPMSAPLMPQSRLFWDQSNDGVQMDLDVPLGVDPFASTPHRMGQNMNWQAFNHQGTNPMQTPAFQSFQASPGHTLFSNPHAEQAHNMRHNSFVATSTSVDPSMLLSTYDPDMTTSPETLQPQSSISIGSRQPYETQLRDAQAEREQVRRARSQHSRSNTNSSSGSTENLKPGLQRSNTDAMVKSRPLTTENRIAIPANFSTIPRRSSPLKRQSGGSMKAIPEMRKPRTRLIIDETGRARTETVSAEDDDETPRAIRRASQQDPRRQYPDLYEQEDSGAEEDEPPPVLSRNASFTVPQPERRAPKHARTDSGGFEGSASFKVARPAPRPSSAFDVASFQSARPIRASAAEYASQRSASADHSRDCEVQSPGDALGALKKLVGERQQRIERASQNTLRAHNQRWAQASAEISNTTPPHANGFILGQYDPFTNTFNGSPTTTPSTDRSSLSSESRCICNGGVDDDNAPMVQCESCNKWLHMGCVGLSKGALPRVYVCVFCTGQTPIARGGRLRGPVPFDSPLNHKTMFRR
ncbi:PHD multi-domain protein [Pyrenophora teres f. maculata]|nr:PHD multi-domain protein [Pyrenophora teres f. maculata]